MYIKELRLIAPETAQALGIPAEAPVFVSPFVKERQRCARCNADFGPLIYQAGYTTTAHHYHDFEGGIYFTRLRYNSYDEDYFDGGWYAVVEPRGRQRYGRAAEVYVAQILAYDIFDRRRLEEGLVITDGWAGALAPIELSSRRQGVICQFRAAGTGEILFRHQG